MLALVGCQTGGAHVEGDPGVEFAQAGQTSVNKTCPLGGHPVSQGHSLNYKGDTIGFCCTDCQTKFLAMDESERDAALIKARKN